MNDQSSLRPPASARLITVLMVVVQSIAAWYLKGSVLFPVVVTTAMALVLMTRRRWLPGGQVRRNVCIVLVAAFMIKSRVAPIHLPSGSVTAMTQFAHAAAQCLLVLQVLLVFMSRHREVLPQLLPWLGALTMICTGDLRVTEVQRVVFQTLVLVYVTLAASFSALNRQTTGRTTTAARTTALGLLLAATAGLGWWGSAMVHSHSSDIENLISTLIDPNAMPQESGFSSQGHLRSVVSFRDRNADDVAMRIYSDTPPGYLRGGVFTEYFTRSWGTDQLKRAILPSLQSDVVTEDGENAFLVAPRDGEPFETAMECWPNFDQNATLFLPDRTACVAAWVDAITISPSGNVTAPELPSGYPYTVYVTRDAIDRELTGAQRRACLDPGASPPVVGELARKLLSQDASFETNLRSVCDYLHGFRYSDKTEAPPGGDPIEWFLSEGRAGHCEYFATAAALILRAGGIPTRYVTGFVAAEQNSYGGYWVVRNRFAHAWVQAWDDRRGQWVIVEATPGDGVPEANDSQKLADFWSFIKDRYQVFRVRLHQRGFGWAVQELLGNAVVRVVIGGLLIWLCLVWKRRLKKQRGDRPAQSNSQVIALARLLAAVDARVRRRHGLVRDTNETLHQFAARIAETLPDSAVPDWYRAYARTRYTPSSNNQIPPELRAAAKSI